MEQTHKINKVEIRNLRMEDYDQLAQSFTRVYADKDVFWTRAQIKKRRVLDTCPDKETDNHFPRRADCDRGR